MSMLTPPGMGGQYRITGDKYPKMRPPRRRGRLVVAIGASVAAVGLIGWGTLQLIDVFTGGHGRMSASGAKTDCTTKVHTSAVVGRALPQPGLITVNVLNATKRGGLAKQTADELRKRGFRIGAVGNATQEYDKKVKGVGILLGAKASPHTSLPVLGTQLAGAEPHTDTRPGTDVDLILGDAFKSLTSKADADKALTALAGDPRPASPTDKNGRKAC